MSAIHLQVKIHRSAFKLDLDLQLPGQGITAIFGPSGSGKTTLLRAVAGLKKTNKGVFKLASTFGKTPSKVFICQRGSGP